MRNANLKKMERNMAIQERLAEEGMSFSESASALDAAEREGREVGTAVEERAHAARRHETAARAVVLPDLVQGVHNILFIHGLGNTSFMEDNLLGVPSDIPGVPPETAVMARALWEGCQIVQVNFNHGDHPIPIRTCKDAIISGRFHAIIVCDLSLGSARDRFAEELGKAVRDFAEAGGAVAFPTSEGLHLQPALQRMFGTTWEASSYYRTTWMPAPGNETLITSTFPGLIGTQSFSAKACSIKNVPASEAFFATTASSRTQSHVPTMAGKPTGSDDVCVAVKSVGAGSIAYFGDVNCEARTIQLVAEYVRSRGGFPASCELGGDDFEAAKEAKARGNDAFKQGNMNGAAAAYGDALACYGPRSGGAGAQREEKVKLLSNLAECYLRLDRPADAADAASRAVDLDPCHVKSRLRRARARYSLATAGDGAALGGQDPTDVLRAARDDLAVVGKQDAQKLLKQVNQRLRSAERAANASFAAGFAAALGAGSAETQGGAARAPFEIGGVPVETVNSVGMPGPATWAEGLTPDKQREWLVDCYRMRIDDEYAWGGGTLRGMYGKMAGGEGGPAITEDFLVFCKLALVAGAVPQEWDWPAFCQVAEGMLMYAFEKSDAKEKYGSENVFSSMTGGRSLRHMGEVIYGSSIQGYGETSEQERRLLSKVRKARGRLADLCSDVGGEEAWKALAESVGERWKGGGKAKPRRSKADVRAAERAADGVDERSMNFGFTEDEVDELLCQGVKPWEDDAHDVLGALHSDYY